MLWMVIACITFVGRCLEEEEEEEAESLSHTYIHPTRKSNTVSHTSSEKTHMNTNDKIQFT